MKISLVTEWKVLNKKVKCRFTSHFKTYLNAIVKYNNYEIQALAFIYGMIKYLKWTCDQKKKRNIYKKIKH